MENRFLEAGYLLNNIPGTQRRKSKNAYSPLNGRSSKSLSFSKSGRTSRSLSVQDRVLVILIENGGVDLGIPELVSKILNALDIQSIIPTYVKDQLIEFLREKIKSFTDNLIETAELSLNRYSSAAPSLFSSVEILRNGTASYQDLKSTLIRLSKENKIIDVLILTHGREDYIAVTGGINSQKIKDIKNEFGKPLSIRSVYMMNCVGSTLNQAWIDAGAKVSSGSIENNYLPEPTTFFFWSSWKEGQNFETAVTGAYRKTINLMNGAVNMAIKTVPLLSNFISSINFENFAFVSSSAPVIQGNRALTINSDDLVFSQSQPVSSLATTVLPVSLLQSLQTSRSLSNGKPRTMEMSAQGLDLIKKFEGFVPKPYNDPVGHCTVGYGTLLHKGKCNGTDASEQAYLNGIDEQQATRLLLERANEFQRIVNESTTVELNQNQYDSLVSLVYNIGSYAFKQSTLLTLLNQGKYEGVPPEMKKWIYGTVDGKKVVLPGLETRRKAEADLFTNSVATAQSISNYKFSKPLYDTGEHSLVAQYIDSVINAPIANVPALLPEKFYSINGVDFTYGQIITMGDFYTDYNQLANASGTELEGLKNLIIRSENLYKNSIFKLGLSNDKDPSHAEWDAATSGRYLELAAVNNSHFAPPPAGSPASQKPNNKETWQYYHAEAIKKVRGGTTDDDLDEALKINAFGDHFLTDAFSAGHLVNKEIVLNKFIKNVLTNGKVNSAGEKMFGRIADATLAIPKLNQLLGKFEVISASWYEPNWDLNDTGAFLPEVFYRLLVKIIEDPKSGRDKIANLAVKAAHDFLNTYEKNGVKGVPVKSYNGKPLNLTGDGTLDKDNIKHIQLAVLQSVNNINDAVNDSTTSLSVFYKKVWDYVPNLSDPVTAGIVNDTISTFTNPASDQLIKKAVSLIEAQLPMLLDELLAGGFIQCRSNTSAKKVSEC